MRDRLRELLSRTSKHPGQVLVLFALLIPAMLGVAGLGVDVAHLYKERRQLQNAVDIAALGGAMMLPDDPTSAEATARQIADLNGVPIGSVTASAGFGGDDSQMEVSATRSVGLFFMPILGIDNVSISARAVAEHKITRGTAVFAKKDTHCWEYSINWTGRGITVDGDAHSNSRLTVSGTNNALNGNLTYQSESGRDRLLCARPMDGHDANPDMPEAKATTWQDWPIDFAPTDFPCDYTITNPNLTDDSNLRLWVDETLLSKRLKSGVICYRGSSWMTLNASGISGNVTLVAKNIDVRGANNNLSAYHNDVLFYATGNGFPSLRLTPSGGTMNGIIFIQLDDDVDRGNPNRGGQGIINGSNGFRLNGSIISWAITLGGSDWSIVNTLEGSPEPVRLVQ